LLSRHHKARSADAQPQLKLDEKIESNEITPVAGWILREQILSPDLQARFCKLYLADFSVVTHLLLCSSSGCAYASYKSNSPPGIFANRVGRVSGSTKR